MKILFGCGKKQESCLRRQEKLPFEVEENKFTDGDKVAFQQKNKWRWSKNKDGIQAAKDGIKAAKDGIQTAKDGTQAAKDCIQIEKDGLQAEKMVFRTKKWHLSISIQSGKRKKKKDSKNLAIEKKEKKMAQKRKRTLEMREETDGEEKRLYERKSCRCYTVNTLSRLIGSV